MFHPLRAQAGIHITAYLDDRLSGSMDQTRAKWEALIQYALMAACGWFLPPAKGCIAPVQVTEFLGLTLDLQLRQFQVPEKKLQLILRYLDKFIQQKGAVSAREMASIAGKVVATTLAVPLAPLLAPEGCIGS